MMRTTAYDDGYITRKMASLQTTPTFLPPAPAYGRSYLTSGYMHPLLRYHPRSRSASRSVYYYPRSLSIRNCYVPSAISRVRYRSLSPSRTTILERALSPTRTIIRERSVSPLRTILRERSLSPVRSFLDYPPMPAPKIRMPAPSYYDMEYGYGGAYGGYVGYPPYAYGYGAPLAPRMSRYESYLDDDCELPAASYAPRYGRATRLADSIVEMEKDRLPEVHYNPRVMAIEGPKTYGGNRYHQLSESQMLQDEVDKMRYRVKGLSYSLDPTGTGASDRSRRATSVESARRYTSAMDAELPRLSARRTYVYPQDGYLKDNLRIKCLSHYKSTRSAAEYYKPKLYSDTTGLSSTYTSKHPLKTSSLTGSKWEEPSTIYSSSDKAPYSKTKGTDDDDTKKERTRKKKSRDHDDYTPKTSTITPAALSLEPAADGSVLEAAAQDAEPEPELDEREKKKLEKKKRKAEREAAAKASLEAELAALAEAEAELALLEAQAAAPLPETAAAPAPAPAPAPEASEPVAPAPIEPVAVEAAVAETPVAAAPAEVVAAAEAPVAKCESPVQSVAVDIPEPVLSEEAQEASVHETELESSVPETTLSDIVSESPMLEVEPQPSTQQTDEPLTEDTGIVSTDQTNVVEQEPVEATHEPTETQQPLESDTAAFEAEPAVEDDSTTLNKDTDTVVEEPVELAEEISEEAVVEEPLVDTHDDEVEPEYTEPARKGFQSETTFDWDDVAESEEKIGEGAGTEGGDEGVAEEPTSPQQEDPAASDTCIEASEDTSQNFFFESED